MPGNNSTNRPFRPSEYLRRRRPERYSDSIVTEESSLTEDLLEYRLETLTSRNQEKEFEHFARRLAEKKLCPNLIPQTGPTGGGDSKVDTETYPVAEEIALRWYQGNGSATERWAFAFSAKKDWRTKIKNDVVGIVGTQRGYSLIYFVTSQFVKDKARAEVEDKLTSDYDIQVKILDRQWIVESVLQHGRHDIAIEHLSIEGLKYSAGKQIGPNDAKRQIQLENLDKEINDPDRYVGVSYQLAEDCLAAAILASELELDRHQVDGRFGAALRIAKEIDDSRQILRIKYRWAWASLFVYDDISELSQLYDDVEDLAFKSRFADDIELLHNLWNALFGSVGADQEAIEKYRLLERGESLSGRLLELSSDDARPNNSLHARTIRCFHSFALSRIAGDVSDAFDTMCTELEDIFNESKGLGQYPFDSFKEIVFELGDLFSDSEAYDRLFSTVLAIVEERTSEGEAGAMLVNRGIQKFTNGRIYDAIRLFGRAQNKLIKDEYQSELVKCLIACGGTYKSAALFWAARSSLLAALSICITNFNSTGYMHGLAKLAARELAWIEIILGRVPNIIFCVVLINFVANNSDLDEDDQKAYWDSLQHIDAVFSMLLLRLDLDQLRTIEKLPYVLERLHLVCSEGALIFALGQTGKLRQDVWFDDNASDAEIERFYNLVCDQPANDDLPISPELYSSDILEFTSNVLGITLVAEVDSNQSSILIAESLLGALEAFLSTSLAGGIMPHKQHARVAIKIDEDNALDNRFGIELVRDSDDYDLLVVHQENFSLDSAAAIQNFREVATNFIAHLLPKIAFYDDKEGHIQRLVEEEEVFSRSTLFSDLMTLSENVFGSLEWLSIGALVEHVDEAAYELKRAVAWAPKVKPRKLKEDLKRGEGEAPDDIADTENLSHSERKVLSVIDVELWDKAHWRGAMFMIFPEGQFPPSIGLLFENEKEARQIFEGWIERLGKKDEKEELRISFVTGIDKNNPAHYRIQIGTNINAYERSGEKGHFVMLARIQTMMPKTTENIDMFLRSFKEYGVYALFPAILDKMMSEPKVIRDLYFIKSALTVKPSWKIGLNDDDFLSLQVGDSPIIPDGIEDAPVLKALERKQEFLNRKKQ